MGRTTSTGAREEKIMGAREEKIMLMYTGEFWKLAQQCWRNQCGPGRIRTRLRASLLHVHKICALDVLCIILVY